MTTLPTSPDSVARNHTPAGSLQALPHPLHLFEGLVASAHYHLGWFEHRHDTLRSAQERLVRRVAARIPRAGPVLDVGSGLGGTIGHLAARGRHCLGIDPCARSIAYARSRFGGKRARFRAATLETLAASSAACGTFAAVLLIESAHRIASVDALLGAARRLLAPGGSLVIADVVRGRTPFDGLVFHARGAIAGRAPHRGFDVVGDATRRAEVAPTLARLQTELRDRAPSLIEEFCGRPSTRRDIRVLGNQFALLGEGLDRDILDYEVVELRRR